MKKSDNLTTISQLEDSTDLISKSHNFSGNLGEYKFIHTADDSKTLWSSFYDETFHNTSGALQETFYTYLEATKANRFLNFQAKNFLPFSILEVGFGMGLGYFALDQFIKLHLSKKTPKEAANLNLRFVSFEIDHQMLEHIVQLKMYSTEILPTLDIWDYLKGKHYQIKKEILIDGIVINFEGIILIGDGRVELKSKDYLKNHHPFHAIFQDAFSPKKNPDLWTVEWFFLLKHLADENVLLSTYSSSTSIRKSLLEAQWILYNQKGFGHKKAMTIASLNENLLGPRDQVVLKKLSLSLNNPIFDRDIKDFIAKRNQTYPTE